LHQATMNPSRRLGRIPSVLSTRGTSIRYVGLVEKLEVVVGREPRTVFDFTVPFESSDTPGG